MEKDEKVTQIKKDKKSKEQELAELIEQDRRERMQACSREIDAVLKKYKCIFAVNIQFRGGRSDPVIEIIPN